MRILFGHQSVGADLLAGLRNDPACPAIVAARQAPAMASFVAHFPVGSNGDVSSKISDFVTAVTLTRPGSLDAALFKFCYVDITAADAAQDAFQRYTAALDELQTRRPDLSLGHVTVPLRAVRYGLRSGVGLLIGRGHPEAERNAAREQFNDRLRTRYGESGRLFDLAACEAGPGKSAAAPRLHASYTNDGGHLNDRGRTVIAGAFRSFLLGLAAQGAAVNSARIACND